MPPHTGEKGTNKKQTDAGDDGVEGGAGAGGPQPPLLLLVQAGLSFPQWLQVLRAWLTALPQDWLVHHHHAWAAPGAGGVLLGLLLYIEAI